MERNDLASVLSNADDIRTRRERDGKAMSLDPPTNPDVEVVQRAVSHPNAYLTLARLRTGQVHDTEDLWTPMLLDAYSSHAEQLRTCRPAQPEVLPSPRP